MPNTTSITTYGIKEYHRFTSAVNILEITKVCLGSLALSNSDLLSTSADIAWLVPS